MFKIEDGVCYLTRGDDASINVTLATASGTAYRMMTGDTVTMTVSAGTGKNDSVLFTSTYEAESDQAENPTSTVVTLPISHDDTKDASYGGYACDIQLTTADGSVFTIFPDQDDRMMKNDRNAWKNFWVIPEVTQSATDDTDEDS